MAPKRKKHIDEVDIAVALAREAELPLRKADEIVTTLFNTITNTLINGDEFYIQGFGRFRVKKYRSRWIFHPITGELMTTKPTKRPSFKSGKDLRDRVRNGEVKN